MMGWTQQNLAYHVGVHLNTVYRWEKGKSEPEPSVRDVLAEALKLSTVELDQLISESCQVQDS